MPTWETKWLRGISATLNPSAVTKVENHDVGKSPSDPTSREIEDHVRTGHASSRTWCAVNICSFDSVEMVFRCYNVPSNLALFRTVTLARTGDIVQETSVNVVKRHIRPSKLAVKSPSGVEMPADHDLLTWLVPHATSMHRRLSVGRDGKTGRSSGSCSTHDSSKEGTWDRWMDRTQYLQALQVEVKAGTMKRLPPSERWNGSLLDETNGSEVAPNAPEDDCGRVGTRAPVLQPHAAVPLPPMVLEFRQR